MSYPKHSPTPEQRKIVKDMSSVGIPQDKISVVIGIDPKTLRVHYREELDTAESEANTKVAIALYDNAIKTNNVTAQIFWLKTRGGWRESRPADDEGIAHTINIKIVGGLPDD